MQRIGILTSGGDSPGMNAAVRALVRKGIYHGREIIGIRRGFAGFIDGDMFPTTLGSVADIIHRGGTMLLTARSDEFETVEGRRKAMENVERFGLEALVVVGGEGSFKGANIFHNEYNIPVIGVPATIDNDIAGTDCSIGFDTAVNTVVEVINKIRDTATSHERTFILEVMGRHSGAIALTAGLAGGAESILIPENPVSIDEICDRLNHGYARGKLHSVIVVAEGAASGIKIGNDIKERTGLDTKVTILGHLQRGGTPTAFDRNLASIMGAKAIDMLIEGNTKNMVGMSGGQVEGMSLEEAFKERKQVDLELYRLAGILSI